MNDQKASAAIPYTAFLCLVLYLQLAQFDIQHHSWTSHCEEGENEDDTERRFHTSSGGFVLVGRAHDKRKARGETWRIFSVIDSEAMLTDIIKRDDFPRFVAF